MKVYFPRGKRTGKPTEDIRNKCNIMMRKDKKDLRLKMYEKFEETENSKDMFKMSRNLLGWKDGNPPSSIWKDGKTTHNPQEIAGTLNKFFNDKIQKLMNDLPASRNSPTELLQKNNEQMENQRIEVPQ